MNYETAKNQEILKALVAKHVRADVTTMTTQLIQAYNIWESSGCSSCCSTEQVGFPEYETIGLRYEYEGEELTEEQKDQQLEQLKASQDAYDSMDEEYDKLQDEIDELESQEGEVPEVAEWWIVSADLAAHLKEAGEVVIEEYDLPIWGRITTQLALTSDNVIGNIARDTEVLEGQKFEGLV